jgi:hypothetical protein
MLSGNTQNVISRYTKSYQLIHKILSGDTQNVSSRYIKCYQLIDKMLSADTKISSVNTQIELQSGVTS